MFRPCKTDRSYEMIPQGKIDRRLLIDTICKSLDGKIISDNPKLTLVDIGNGKISISSQNKILIKEIEKEEDAKIIANKIMRNLLR